MAIITEEEYGRTIYYRNGREQGFCSRCNRMWDVDALDEYYLCPKCVRNDHTCATCGSFFIQKLYLNDDMKPECDECYEKHRKREREDASNKVQMP